MNPLAEYRRKLIESLATATQDFCTGCELKAASTGIAGDWSMHQLAAHVRDIHRAVYAARIRRTLVDENPLFQSFDPDEWMAGHYNTDEPLPKILNEFKTEVNDLCKTLNDLASEAWSRLSQHATMGEGLTLQIWCEHGLAHIHEHLKAVRELT